MDVRSITQKCDVHIDAYMPEGEGAKYFVPLYSVHWTSKEHNVRGCLAEVKFVEPTKTVIELRVSRREYILSKPLQIKNISYLLSLTNNSSMRGESSEK
jgi:hypothetical protein